MSKRAKLEVELFKKCMQLWCQARFAGKMAKHHRPAPEVEMAKKCTRLLREAHFKVSFFVPGAEREGEGEEEGEGEVAFPGF